MKVSTSEDYPGLYSLEFPNKRNAFRLLPDVGIEGGIKLLAGMVWQGPAFKGIAVEWSNLVRLAERKPQKFPEIAEYVGETSVLRQVAVDLLRDVDEHEAPYIAAVTLTATEALATEPHSRFVQPHDEAKSA